MAMRHDVGDLAACQPELHEEGECQQAKKKQGERVGHGKAGMAGEGWIIPETAALRIRSL